MTFNEILTSELRSRLMSENRGKKTEHNDEFHCYNAEKTDCSRV